MNKIIRRAFSISASVISLVFVLLLRRQGHSEAHLASVEYEAMVHFCPPLLGCHSAKDIARTIVTAPAVIIEVVMGQPSKPLPTQPLMTMPLPSVAVSTPRSAREISSDSGSAGGASGGAAGAGDASAGGVVLAAGISSGNPPEIVAGAAIVAGSLASIALKKSSGRANNRTPAGQPTPKVSTPG
jgi:hypothetical protein